MRKSADKDGIHEWSTQEESHLSMHGMYPRSFLRLSLSIVFKTYYSKHNGRITASFPT